MAGSDLHAGGLSMPMFEMEPRDSAALRWSKWLDRVDNYLVATDIDSPTRRRAILLHLIGEDMYDIYKTMSIPKPDSDKGETVYDVTKKALTDHFTPESSYEFELFQFRGAIQGRDEDLDTYYARLKLLARNCHFPPDRIEAEIKSQIVQKCNIQKIRDEGITNGKLTLTDILKIGRTQEASKRQAKVMEKRLAAESGAAEIPSVNKLGTSPTRQKKVKSKAGTGASKSQGQFQNKKQSVPGGNCKKSKTCYSCGGKWPHQKGKTCPAIGRICANCGQKNHFASVCQNQSQKNVRVLESVPGDKSGDMYSEEYEDMFHISEVSSSRCAYQVDLKINGVETKMEIDTGASISIMNSKLYKNLCHPKVKPVLRKSNLALRTYTGELIVPEGEVDVTVEYKEQCKKLTLTILPGNGPSLIGRNWLEEIKLDWSSVYQVKSDESVLTESFPDLFRDELGKLKDTKVKIYVDSDATPVFCKARSVPLAMKDKVMKELGRLEREGVIKSVNYSEWAAPIVPVIKSSGQVRICGDYKVTINKVAKVDRYPLPHIDELYAKLSGGQLFSKLDLSNAYQQLPLDEASQKLTTINTPKGLFMYTRLPFGVSTAPGIFQRTLETLLQEIPKTAVYLDDILVSGSTPEEHHKNLNDVLTKLQKSGLRLKRSKCLFYQKSVTYLGHVIDGEGVHPTPSKLQSIEEAPAPTCVSELRSYLGMLNYYNKFIPNSSTVLKPLYDLLQHNVKWSWTEVQSNAFKLSKKLLQSSTLLVHYNPELKLLLECDASPTGLGVVLSHELENGEQKPIAFASRTLAPSERKYAQIEKEGLSIVFGVKHFHKYLYGRHFSIVTDHKPLLGLFKEYKPVPVMASARIQRWALLLGGYSYNLLYKPGKMHSNADALSRLPSSQQPTKIPDPPELVFSFSYLDQCPLSSQDIAKETRHDPLLSQVMQMVYNGWPAKSKDSELQPYFVRRNELTVQGDCLLWGSRVVVPQKFRASVLSDLHETHQGIVRMKLLSRSFVWWPNIDRDIEQEVKRCTMCQQRANSPPVAPLNPWPYSTVPWARIHIDYAGPFENKMILIIVDSSSKFMDAHVMNGSTSSATIDRLRHTFAMHGLPKEIVSDNGTTFVSSEFQCFCQENGIHHIRVSPYHPASNGLAERGVQTVKNGLKKISVGSLESRLYRFLLTYNITPHVTTGESPSMLLMKRKLRSRLDLLRPDVEAKVHSNQIKMKQQHDKQARSRSFYVGDAVFARNFLNKPKWMSGVIQEKLGPVSFLVELPDGRVWKRHVDHLRSSLSVHTEQNLNSDTKELVIKDKVPYPFPPSVCDYPPPVPDFSEVDKPTSVQNQKCSTVNNECVQGDNSNASAIVNLPTKESQKNSTPQTPRRSTRVRHQPQRLADYVS